ncbi:MAG: PAS domain-containing sensor histidine kinase, partial [Rubrivivax sp.]
MFDAARTALAPVGTALAAVSAADPVDSSAPTTATVARAFAQAQPALAAAAVAARRAALDQVQHDRQQREAALAALALLATGALAWAGIALRGQRRSARTLARRASVNLGSGAWQDAVQSLRDDRAGAPSAFDALASGVEEVMGASERRWQTLADLAADWYWETDPAHRLAWMSGAGALVQMQGLRPQDMLGRRYDEVSAFEPPADGWQRLHTLMDSGRSFRNLELQVRLAGADAEPLWVALSGRARGDAAGGFAGYEGVGRDVSERRRAHERLRASEQRWALMAGLASDYYWEADTEHRLQPLRPEVARRFGRMAEHSEGRTPWRAFPDAMAPERWEEYRADVAARRPYRGVEMDLDIGDGRRRIVSTSGVPRFDGSGRFLGYHGIGRDITMRREAERLMLRHNETLQRAVAERTQDLELINRDLDAFARELAHELRTPIGQMQGLARLLVSQAGDRLASDEMQLIGLQLQAARHMRETVDALLQLARSTGQPMGVETVDASSLAHEVIAELPELDRRQPVTWQIDPGLQVRATPEALRIVLANLLGNAAKFTRHTAAPVVRLSGRLDPDGRLRLRVQDNGAGFDMAQVHRLFKPFGRLHRDDAFEGSGIGLTIVHRVVERHGGTTTAYGAPGEGAWFEFTLARGESPAVATPGGASDPAGDAARAPIPP